jgi:hypothetical protein
MATDPVAEPWIGLEPGAQEVYCLPRIALDERAQSGRLLAPVFHKSEHNEYAKNRFG